MSDNLEQKITEGLNSLTEKLSANNEVIRGKDVDWSNYDLDKDIAHLYNTAVLQTIGDRREWVAQLEVFDFSTAPYTPSKRTTKTLGEEVTQRVNGPERWKIATVFSNQPGLGTVMFSRTVTVALPDPRPLITGGELEPVPSEDELSYAQDAANQWMKTEGITPPPEDTIVQVEGN